jgi:muconolactone delta-isomerase
MKFLVMFRMELALLSTEMAAAVAKMPQYADPLEHNGKVVARYHLVGQHGGAWIYDVESNEELEMLLARSPVYNYSSFEVLPLAEMAAPPVTE